MFVCVKLHVVCVRTSSLNRGEEPKAERTGDVDGFPGEGGRAERESGRINHLGVHQQLRTLTTVSQMSLYGLHECNRHPLSKLVDWSEEVQDLHNLSSSEDLAHGADGLCVLISLFLHLQQLSGLNQWLQSLLGPTCHWTFVSEPLLPLAHIIPDLHAFAPRTNVLAQQQVVEGDSADDVEVLLHHLLDDSGIGIVLAHGGVEGAELQQDGVQCVGICDAGRLLTETRGLHP